MAAHEAEVQCGLLGGRLASFLVPSELPGAEVTVPAQGLWLG